MSFDVSTAAYGRFMGRYSEPLAMAFADAVDVRRGQRALDVGCGAGALTAVLVERLGADQVRAIDPSPAFVAALPGRLPGVEVRIGTAEQLPYDDALVDLTLAQLVVHFMSDPVVGLAEMARVTAPGGVVAATVWDHAGGQGPLAAFWRAARDLDPSTPDESHLPGVAEGHLAQLFADAGMPGARSSTLVVRVEHPSFDEWWEPFTLGVGPAGAHVAALDESGRSALRERCRALLPAAPFVIAASAWTVVWHKPA
jgi:SAM-dependent methyltransferase